MSNHISFYLSRALLISFCPFILLASEPSFALSGGGVDHVGNGGGLVENQFVYVWTNLKSFLQPCLIPGACGFSPDEQASFARVANVAAQDSSPAPLSFVSAKNFPDLFSPGTPWSDRVALRKGEVFVNTDALYSDDQAVLAGGKLSEPLPYLLAALGMMAGEQPDFVWSWTRKVQNIWDRESRVLSGAVLGAPAFYLQMISGKKPGDFASASARPGGFWLISDQTRITDITPLLMAKLPCANSRSIPLLLSSHNANWVGAYTSDERSWQLIVAASLDYVCVDSESGQQEPRMTAEVKATFAVVEGSFKSSKSYVRIYDSHPQ